jgi:hypothetical protein
MTRFIPPGLSEIESLRYQLLGARSTILHMAPKTFWDVLTNYRDAIKKKDDFRDWYSQTLDTIIARAGHGHVLMLGRVACPLCRDLCRDDGYIYPSGLRTHLTGYGNVSQCSVTEALHHLAWDYSEKVVAEAESVRRVTVRTRPKRR